MIRSLFACALLAVAPSFAEGIKDITPAEAQTLMKEEKPPVIIDVRTPAEFKKGHLKGAKNINSRDQFEDNLAKLDPSKRYIFHCKSGGRSTATIATWKSLGFTEVYHLKSGYLGWQKAKLPVVIDPPSEK